MPSESSNATNSSTPPPPRGGWRQLVVIVYVGALVALSVRSLVTQDSRYGWGMFSRNTQYIARFHWVYANGSREEHQPGLYISGAARQILPKPVDPVGGFSARNTRYGMGTMRYWIDGYLKWVFEEHRPENAVAIEARVYYAINNHVRVRDSGLKPDLFEYSDTEHHRVKPEIKLFRYPRPSPDEPAPPLELPQTYPSESVGIDAN